MASVNAEPRGGPAGPRLYAVGIGGGWVQIRSHTSKPRLVRSTAKRKVTYTQPGGQYYDIVEGPFGHTYGVKQRPPQKVTKDLTLTVQVYEGGKVLSTMTRQALFKKMRNCPVRDGLMELTPAQAKLVMGTKWSPVGEEEE